MKLFEKLALVRCEMQKLQNEVSSKNCEIENLKEIVRNLKNATEKITVNENSSRSGRKGDRILL